MTSRAWWLAALLLAACSSAAPKKATPADYDRSCTTRDDCAAVFVGDPGCCGVFDCANTAVRQTDAMRATMDSSAARTCSGPLSCPAVGPCTAGPPICVAGQCQLWQHPSTLSADNYDRSCTTIDDCAPVFVGILTTCGGCPNTAVRADQVDFVASDVKAASGIFQPCPATPRCTGRIQCEGGLCMLAQPPDAGATADAAKDE